MMKECIADAIADTAANADEGSDLESTHDHLCSTNAMMTTELAPWEQLCPLADALDCTREGWDSLREHKDPSRCDGVQMFDGVIRRICVTGRPQCTADVWHKVFATLPSLTHLELIYPGDRSVLDGRLVIPQSLSLATCLVSLKCLGLAGDFPWRLLTQFVHLQQLRFRLCKFSPCEVDPALEGLTALTDLHLVSCNIHGVIPPLHMPQIIDVCLKDNHLEGELPAAMEQWTALQSLSIEQNTGLCGFIPKSLLLRPHLHIGTAGTHLKGDLVSFHAWSFQMHLLDRDTVLGLDQLPRYEDITDKHCTVYLQDHGMMDIDHQRYSRVFVSRSRIAFFSQRWLRPEHKHPDDEANSKWQLIHQILRRESDILYIWIDLACIPQASQSGRSAVNSLPCYVQHCGHFFMLHGTPNDLRAGRQRDPSFAEYLSGGWTRQEIMTAQCPVQYPNGTWHAVQIHKANFDTGEVLPFDFGSDLADPIGVDAKQIPRNQLAKGDPHRRLDHCHRLLMPGVEATLEVLVRSPKVEALRPGIDKLQASVARAKGRRFVTAPVEGEPAGTVERGGVVNGHRDGLHVRLSADRRTQYEVLWSNGVMVGQPRQMSAWEQLPVWVFYDDMQPT